MIGNKWNAICLKVDKTYKVFFIKVKVNQKEIMLKNCPTEEMWAGILTKSKQGRTFKEF